jgi:hypothetical protein
VLESSDIKMTIPSDINYVEIYNLLGECKGSYHNNLFPHLFISTHGFTSGVYNVILYGKYKVYYRTMLIQHSR